MSTTLRPAVLATAPPHSPGAWRLAGSLAIAHLVLMLAGIITSGTPTIHEGQEGIEHSYVGGSLTRIFSGGYIEMIGFVLLVPVLVFLARSFGRRSDVGAWAAQTAAAAGLCYVAVVVAGGFAAGAASAWGSSHGLDLETSLAINNIRNFAYFLSLALLGAHAIGLGVAALTDRIGTRWVGWGGVLTGLVLVTAVPVAWAGVQDYATLVWIVWWVGLAVHLLRRPGSAD